MLLSLTQKEYRKALFLILFFLQISASAFSQRITVNPIVENDGVTDDNSVMIITSVITGLGDEKLTLVTLQYATLLFNPWISLDSKTFITTNESTTKLQILEWGTISEDEENPFSSLRFNEQLSCSRRTPYNLYMVFPKISENATLLNIQESTTTGFQWRGIQLSSEPNNYSESLSQIKEYKQLLPILQEYKLLQQQNSIGKLFHVSKIENMSDIDIGVSYLEALVLDSAEVYLQRGLELIEREHTKYSKEYCDNLPLLIRVYDLSYNYDALINHYLDYLDILENIYDENIPEFSQSLTTLGYLYISVSQYEFAEKCLMHAIELRERNFGKESDEYILTLNNLGLLYLNLTNYQKAHDVFSAIKVTLENKIGVDLLFYTSVIVQLGVVNTRSGNYKDAENYLLEAKSILEDNKMTNVIQYITILTQLGELFFFNNNYIDAENYLLNAQNTYLQLGGDKYNTNYSFIIADLAQLYNTLGDYEKAEQYFTEALQILEKTIGIENAWYATTMSNLGIMYFQTGDYINAEDVFLKTKEIQENVLGKNHIDYARTLGNLGTLYVETENFQLAEKHLLKSKEIYDNAGYKTAQYSMLLNSLALLRYKMGDSVSAFDNLMNSQEVIGNLSGYKSPDYALTMLNLSGILNERGNDTLAVKYAINAILIFEENFGKEHPHYILTLNNIGKIRTQQGIYDKAEWQLLEANELYKKTFGEDYIDRVMPLCNLSYLYAKQERYDLALKYILEAQELIEKSSDREHSYYFTIIESLSGLYWLNGDYEKSAQFTKEWCNSLSYKLNSNFSFMSERQREDFWWNSNAYELNHFMKVLLAAYPTFDTQILTYNNTLFSKGLLLRSSNEVNEAILNSGNQELINQFEELRSIRQQITFLQTKADRDEEYIISLEKQAEGLDKSLSIASSEYRDIKSDLNIDWKEIQRNLSDNEVAIEFIDYEKINIQWSDTTMYGALIIRKDFESPIFVPLFEELQMDTLLNDNNSNTEKRIDKLYNSGNPRLFNGQKLYQLIWQPLEMHLDDVETVYYSPSGLLNQISFAAIPVDSVLLSDKYKLHLLSSTREIVRIKMKKEDFLPVAQAVQYGGIYYDVVDKDELIASAQQYKNEEMQYFASRSLFVDSTRSGWNYLQGTEKEVHEVGNILQKSRIPTLKYMGANANEESFKALSGHSPQLLHIATHGFFLADEKTTRNIGFIQMFNSEEQSYINPLLRSGLLFAGANRAWKNEDVIPEIEDGILTAEEISQLNLSQTKLAVLSACETGLGEVRSDGVFGLQRAFKLAGVETLVMSLWKVDDKATSQFMTKFYQNLMSGKSKLDSFRDAQQTIRDEYKSPYYWAGFVMMG